MNSKHYILLFLLIQFGFTTKAQTERILSKDSTWSSNGIISINIGQTSFTNWASGGENQVNINTILHYRLRYKHNKSSWENIIEAKYGTVILDEFYIKKTDDKLAYTSKFGYKASKRWNYSYYLSLNSQFTAGYNYPNDSVPISDFMAPGYIFCGLGMDYFPVEELSILISPITNKLSIVNNNLLSSQGQYGMRKLEVDTINKTIKPSQKFKNEPGAFIKFHYQKEFKKGLNISSKLELFSAFDKNGIIDVNWSTFLTYKISKMISANFSLDIVYDDDAIIRVDSNNDGVKEIAGPRLQSKQTFGIGIAINL